MSNRYDVEVRVGGKLISVESDIWGYLGKDSTNALAREFYKTIPSSPTLGDGGSITVTLSWKHTRKTREWSAATKAKVAATRAATHAAKMAAYEAKRDREQRRAIAQLQERVKHQVDHAFTLGKHGTEPAAKFITCGHCNAPAAFLGLNQPLAGAQVVNEDVIVGVVCKEHEDTKAQYRHYTRNWVEMIPCSKLEFFYDGIRQIAVKP